MTIIAFTLAAVALTAAVTTFVWHLTLTARMRNQLEDYMESEEDKRIDLCYDPVDKTVVRESFDDASVWIIKGEEEIKVKSFGFDPFDGGEDRAFAKRQAEELADKINER